MDLRGPNTLKKNISNLINEGFENTIPIIDNKFEIDQLDRNITRKCKIGIRIASEEEPKFEFYTSRLEIRYNDIIPYYEEKIKNNPKVSAEDAALLYQYRHQRFSLLLE